MANLIMKQLKRILKAQLPNIKIVPNENNIMEMDFSFYYRREKKEDTYPLLIPPEDMDGIFVNGKIYLDNYPREAPKLVIDGDLAHCHVYSDSDGKYKICFSLDRSYQWFFKDSQMRVSKHNSSMSLKYYIINVYKFLAEDDREIDVSDSRTHASFTYWKEYPHKLELTPENTMSYQKAIEVMQKSTETKQDVSKQINDLYKIIIPKKVSDYVDFIDKTPLLLECKPIVIPVLTKRNSQGPLSFSIVGSELMKYDTIELKEDIFYRTALGFNFNYGFPIILSSHTWKLTNSDQYLVEVVKEMCSTVYTNPIITTNRHMFTDDLILYTICKLFNQLIVDILEGNLPLCEQLVMCFVRLQHQLLYLKNNNTVVSIVEEIFEIYQNQPLINKAMICPDWGILLPLNFIGFTQINFKDIFFDIVARSMSSFVFNSTNKKHISYDMDKSKFIMNRTEIIIPILWNACHKESRRLLIYKVYNNMMSSFQLNMLDECFGNIDSHYLTLLKNTMEETTKFNVNEATYFQLLEILDISSEEIFEQLDVLTDYYMRDQLIKETEKPLVWTYTEI